MTVTSQQTNLDLAHAVYRRLSGLIGSPDFDNRLLAYCHAIVQTMVRLKEDVDYDSVVCHAVDIEPLMHKYLRHLAAKKQGHKGSLTQEQALDLQIGLSHIANIIITEGQQLYRKNPHYKNYSRRVVALKLYCSKKAVLDATSHNLSKLHDMDHSQFLKVQQTLQQLQRIEPGHIVNAF